MMSVILAQLISLGILIAEIVDDVAFDLRK